MSISNISIETLAAARKYARQKAKEEGVNQIFLSDFKNVGVSTLDFCKSVAENENVKAGNSFQGGISLTDMPFNGNAECRIDVIESTLGGHVLSLELISANIKPYRWYGTYWNNNFSGWQALITDAHLQEEYTVEVSENTGGDYAKSYTIKQGGKTLSTINIPKDMVVSSGQLVENPTGYPKGKYIELVLANSDNTKIYIAVSDLVDVYTTETGATQIQLSINNNVISAKIVPGSISENELNVSLKNKLNGYELHISKTVTSEDGVHGLRYYNGILEYEDNGVWKPVSISSLMI